MDMNIRKTIIVIVSAITLTACGEKQPENAQLQQPSSASQPSASAKAAMTSAPAGNPSTPLEAYKELQSGDELMGHYFRFKPIPDDLTSIASANYAPYQREQDSFKKRDALAKYKVELQAHLEAAKKSPYVVIHLPERAMIGKGALGAYDFEKKSFPVGFFMKEKVYESSRYDPLNAVKSQETVSVGPGLWMNDNRFSTLYFSNWKNFEYLAVTDETKARDLEGKRNQYRTRDHKGVLQVRIYAFINGLADDTAPQVRVASNAVSAQIMKLQLLDLDNAVIAEK